MLKKIIIPVLLLVFIAVFYSLSVYSLPDVDLFEQSFNIRDVKSSHEFKLDLKPQTYFLKIKLFKNTEKEIPVDVFLNGAKLNTQSKKVKNDYIKLYFDLDRSLAGNDSILRLYFKKELPESILFSLANFKKSVTKDITIFPSDKQFSRSGKSANANFIWVMIFIAGLWLFVFFIFRNILKLRNNTALATYTFLPSALVNFIFLLPIILGYRIIITPFMFWFILLTSVSLVALFYSVREYFIYPKQQRQIASNVFFYPISFCIVLCIFCLACELLSRIYLTYNYPVKIFKISDKYISYVLNPGIELKFANGFVKINKDGYRGNLFPVNKDKEAKRLILLGDSMVFGFGLNEKDTLSEQLSDMANENQKTEVLNFAVTGYNAYQERLLFERKVPPYTPDIFILGFCLNDIGGNIYTPTAFNTLNEIGEFNYRYEDFSSMEKMQYFLLRHSYFYQYLFYKWKVFSDKFIVKKADYKPLTLSLIKWELDQDMVKALELFKQDMLTLKSACDKNNIKFIIIAYGNELQLDDAGLRKPQEWLNKFCQDNGIYFLDLLPAFEGFSKDEILIDQGHPSSFGNKILAEYLYGFLKANNLLQ